VVVGHNLLGLHCYAAALNAVHCLSTGLRGKRDKSSSSSSSSRVQVKIDVYATICLACTTMLLHLMPFTALAPACAKTHKWQQQQQQQQQQQPERQAGDIERQAAAAAECRWVGAVTLAGTAMMLLHSTR
jgi:hypothetical protein